MGSLKSIWAEDVVANIEKHASRLSQILMITRLERLFAPEEQEALRTS